MLRFRAFSGKGAQTTTLYDVFPLQLCITASCYCFFCACGTSFLSLPLLPDPPFLLPFSLSLLRSHLLLAISQSLLLYPHFRHNNPRRPCFSPDGSLLFCPTGVHRPFPPPREKESKENEKERDLEYERKKSFCTHIFVRSQLSIPAISLIGLEDPSTAVRCSPILYKLVPSTSKSTSNKDVKKKEEEAGSADTNITPKEPEPDSMIPGRYRIMFAVVTVSAVMVYDTQHEVP
jgi:hypothetical protein